jgi:diadenosine tetraphosphate (Ap4A) HIT family hydrolase
MLRISREETHALVGASAARAAALDPCVMCAMVRHGWQQSLEVLRTEAAVVQLDSFARSKGHCLVILPQHEERFEDLPEATYLALHQVAHRVARALRQTLGPLRIYVAGLGAPSALDKTFPHVHLHIVPVYTDDESSKPANMLSWAQGCLQYEPGEAEALLRTIKTALRDS